MTVINNILPADVTTTRQTSASEQEQAALTKRVSQPPYETAAAPAGNVALSRGSPSLPAPQHIDGEQARAGLDAISENVSVDYTAIAIMMVKLASEASKASRDAQIADILSVAAKREEAAEKIKSGAGLALAGGIISGVGQIASGGISVAGGVQSYRIASQAPTTEAPVTAPEEESSLNTELEGETSLTAPEEGMSERAGTMEEETQTTRANREETVEEVSDEIADHKAMLDKLGGQQGESFILSQKANSISLRTQGYSQFVTGASQAAGAGFKYGSDHLQAESKKDDASAEKMNAMLEREKQYGDSLQKSSQDMRQEVMDMLQSQHQTSSQLMQSPV